MNKYSSYKPSEIEWLGKLTPIPSHWQVRRVKDLGDYQSGEFIDASEFDSENVFPVFGGNGIRGYASKFNHNGKYILIGRQGALCGNINYASGKFWATEHAVVVYKKNRYDITWLGELFKVMNFNQYSLSAAQPGLSVDRLKRLELPIPPESEQKTIADFLLLKTKAIDSKIEILEKKALNYKKLHKTVISKSVTHGLETRVDLIDNELGFKTPSNWKKFRLKDLGKLYSGLSGKGADDFNQDDNPDNKGFIPFTNIANNIYLKHDHLGTVVIDKNDKQNQVKKGDVFFLMSSEGYEDIGKTAALTEDLGETYLNSFCKGFRANPRKCNPYFLNYLMLSDLYRHTLIVEGKGFTRINLKMEKVSDFLIYIPSSISEQEEIVKYLDNKLNTISKIVSNIELQIKKLKELRKTLINDVVTGKIKVTDN